MTTDDPWLRSRMVALRDACQARRPIYVELAQLAGDAEPVRVAAKSITFGQLQRLFRALRMEHESD